MPTSGHVNMSAIVSKLNISEVYARFPRERNMQVKLPKFKLDFNQDLQDAMISMGENPRQIYAHNARNPQCIYTKFYIISFQPRSRNAVQ